MKKFKLLKHTSLVFCFIFGLSLISCNNQSSYSKVVAEEPNSSEVVESNENSKELDEIIKDYLDDKFSQYEWYQENRVLISAGVTFIVSLFGAMVGHIIMTHRSNKAISNMNNATGNVKTLANNQTKIEDLQKKVESLESKNKKLIEEINKSNNNISNMKDAMLTVYGNDPSLNDGRGARVIELLDDNKEKSE